MSSTATYKDSQGRDRCAKCHIIDCDGGQGCRVIAESRLRALGNSDQSDGKCHLVLFNQEAAELADSMLPSNPMVRDVEKWVNDYRRTKGQSPFADKMVSVAINTIIVDNKARFGVIVSTAPGSAMRPQSVLNVTAKGIIFA